jgi:hypothetical protein
MNIQRAVCVIMICCCGSLFVRICMLVLVGRNVVRVKLRNSDDYVSLARCYGVIKAHVSGIVRIGTPAGACIRGGYIYIIYTLFLYFFSIYRLVYENF